MNKQFRCGLALLHFVEGLEVLDPLVRRKTLKPPIKNENPYLCYNLFMILSYRELFEVIDYPERRESFN